MSSDGATISIMGSVHAVRHIICDYILDVHLPNILLGIGASIEIPLVTILGRRLELTKSEIANFVLLCSLFRSALDIPFSFLIEYIGVRTMMLISLMINTAAAVVGRFIVDTRTLALYCVLSGMSLGAFFLSRHIFVARISSRRNRGTLMAFLSGLFRWSHVVGPTASGVMATVTGDIRNAFVLAAAASLLASFSILSAPLIRRGLQVTSMTAMPSTSPAVRLYDSGYLEDVTEPVAGQGEEVTLGRKEALEVGRFGARVPFSPSASRARVAHTRTAASVSTPPRNNNNHDNDNHDNDNTEVNNNRSNTNNINSHHTNSNATNYYNGSHDNLAGNPPGDVSPLIGVVATSLSSPSPLRYSPTTQQNTRNTNTTAAALGQTVTQKAAQTYSHASPQAVLLSAAHAAPNTRPVVNSDDEKEPLLVCGRTTGSLPGHMNNNDKDANGGTRIDFHTSLLALPPGLAVPQDRPPLTVAILLRTIVVSWSLIWRLGLFVVFFSALRANRKLMIMFAGMQQRMSDASLSYVLSFSFCFDAVLFPLGGVMMDLLPGRAYAVLPVTVGLASVFTVLPLCNSVVSVYVLSAAFGVVDSLGCGVVMTLIANRAPAHHSGPFFGIVRTLEDVGHVVGAGGVSYLMRQVGFRYCSWILALGGYLVALWAMTGIPDEVEEETQVEEVNARRKSAVDEGGQVKVEEDIARSPPPMPYEVHRAGEERVRRVSPTRMVGERGEFAKVMHKKKSGRASELAQKEGGSRRSGETAVKATERGYGTMSGS